MHRLAVLAAALMLGGCAMGVSVAGHTEDYSEVFYGEGTSDGFNSRYTLAFEPSRATCNSAGQAMDILGHWRDSFTCSDGRSGTWDTYPVALGNGAGDGVLSDGQKISVGGGLKGYAERLINEFRLTQAARAPKAATVATQPPPTAKTDGPASRFPEQPVAVRFPKAAERPDDIAVIIGNADYARQGRDIPDVKPAHADAESARLYATQALGIKDGNIIFLKDATGAQMTRVFGSKDNPRGQLSDWVKPGRSRVFVYYSGHGAPGAQGGSPSLIPVDSDAARIELNGYPLRQLYDNLGKLPATGVTVVLEACFSGVSPAGSVVGNASPVFLEVKSPPVPPNLTVIAAGAANQMASWEQDGSSGLFTKNFLDGMAGKADFNKDGKVTLDELDRYLKETLTYYARRLYGRDQTAQITTGGPR